jgi:hypothetical protein
MADRSNNSRVSIRLIEQEILHLHGGNFRKKIVNATNFLNQYINLN